MSTRSIASGTVAVAVLIAAIGAWLAFGASDDVRPDGTSPQRRALITFTGAARYPEYRNVRQLATASTIVVRATAVRQLSSYRERPTNVPTGLPARKAAFAGVIKTDVVFRVASKLYGKGRPRQVRVVHLGGQTQGQRLIIEGEPVSSVGRSYILFLRAGSDGRYSILGGGQGRYRIINGRLQLVSQDVAEAPVPKALRGLRATTFERQFDTLLRSRNFDAPTSDRLTSQDDLKSTPAVDKPAPPPGRPPPHP